jgi:hypothetical protein
MGKGATSIGDRVVGGNNPSNLGACAHFLGMSGLAFAVFYGCWMKAHYEKQQPPGSNR